MGRKWWKDANTFLKLFMDNGDLIERLDQGHIYPLGWRTNIKFASAGDRIRVACVTGGHSP
jgi:hypothetical protein